MPRHHYLNLNLNQDTTGSDSESVPKKGPQVRLWAHPRALSGVRLALAIAAATGLPASEGPEGRSEGSTVTGLESGRFQIRRSSRRAWEC